MARTLSGLAVNTYAFISILTPTPLIDSINGVGTSSRDGCDQLCQFRAASIAKSRYARGARPSKAVSR
jgi:hypothetical protein